MRKTVGSAGIALVGLILSIKGLLRIISRHLGMDTRLMELTVLIKMMKRALKLSKKMTFLVIIDVFLVIYSWN